MLTIPVLHGGTYAPAMLNNLHSLLDAIRKRKIKSFEAYTPEFKKVAAYKHGNVLWFYGGRSTFDAKPERVFMFTDNLYLVNARNKRILRMISRLARVKADIACEIYGLVDELEKA